MKKFIKTATMLLAFALLTGFAACGPFSDDSSPDNSSSVSTGSDVGDSSSVLDDSSSTVDDSSIQTPTYEYSLNLDSFALTVNDTQTLRVFVDPEKEITVQWSSSNPEIATVENGVVTGVSAGTATITAAVDGETLTCAVTVNPLPITYTYALSQTSANLTIGDDVQLNVIATPEKDDVSVAWSSTAPSVATVDDGTVTAVGVGTATINALVDGETLTCTVVVTSPVMATATIAQPASADLTDNHETLDTLYWEHYSTAGRRYKMFAEQYVTSSNIAEKATNGYGDFAIPLSYNDGVGNLAYHANRNGVHTPNNEAATLEFKVKIDKNVKAIRLYTGVWKATNTVTLLWNDIVVSTAEAFTAGDSSTGREVTFTLDKVDPSITELTVRVTASAVSGGNISIPGIVILGNAEAQSSSVTVDMTKEEMPNLNNGTPENEIFLTEKGTQDWYYFGANGGSERMSGGNMILSDKFDVEGNQHFDDYKGNFTWSNGSTTAVSEGVNNDGEFGSYASLQTKVNAETDHVYVWVGGFSSTYYVEVYNVETGACLVKNTLLASEESGVTHSFELDLAVNATTETTLMINIYRTTGANCSVAAIAVHKPVTYEYTLNETEVEVQAETTWENLSVSVSPDRRFSVSYVSENEEIAIVDANGRITGVAEGETRIKVLIDGEESDLACNVTVTPAPVEYSYALSKESATLIPNETLDLDVVITPIPTEAPTVEWASEKTDVATVDANGVVTAKADGTTKITATVDDKTFTCEVTVKTKVTASVSVTDPTPAKANLMDNDATLDTLYWEHYEGSGANGMKGANDFIDFTLPDRSFGDFKIRFFWANGTIAPVGNNNGGGVHTTGDMPTMEATVQVNPSVKAIRVYTGAWNATNTTSLLYNGVELAKANSFTAGGDSVAKELTFAIDVKEEITLTLRVAASDINGGNASLCAITVLGEGTVTAPTASVSLEKTHLENTPTIDLTARGDLDWFYPESNVVDGEPWDDDEKKDGAYIDGSSFVMNTYNWFNDYGAKFTWTNGTRTENITSIDKYKDGNRCGRWGAISSLTTKVSPETKHVYLWTSAWNSDYNVMVMDSKGNIILNEQIATANGNQPYELNFAINTATEETLTFVVYATKSDNCSIVAMAVSGVEDFDYTANRGEATLFEGETSDFFVTVSPSKVVTKAYSSSDNKVATVDENGEITAVGAGTAVITLVADGKTFTCKVTVNARPAEYTYTINTEKAELIPTQTLQLSVTVSPQNDELVITWESTLSEYASVDENGLVTAKTDGTTTINALVNDEIVASCEVTVKTYVTAGAVTVEDGAGKSVNLTEKLDETLDTLYWEHYQGNGVDAMLNATDMILSNSIESGASGFNDYKASMTWNNGSLNTSWGGNTNGLCYGGETVMTISVNPSVKQIRLYTGAWNASAYCAIYQGDIKLVQSETFSTGGDGIARFVTFNLTVSEATTLTIRITPTPNPNSGGNASLVAVAILGTKTATPTTSVTMTKTEMTGHNNHSINLTEMGAKDWYYTNYEGSPDEKKDGTAIDISSLKQEGTGKFWDYKASFTWTDGTTNETSPTDNDGPSVGSNNGICGAWVRVGVNVDENTESVRLWVGGYQSDYWILVIDSQGNVISNEFMHERTDSTVAYQVDYAINATKAEQLTFVIYRPNGNNCSLAAVAVK